MPTRWGERPRYGGVWPLMIGLDAPLSYPRYYHHVETVPLGVTPVEPGLLSAWASAPLLIDSNQATGYSVATGVSALPVALLAAGADFGVDMRLSQVQVLYLAGFSGAASGRTMTYTLSTGVDNGSGGITWTQRQAGSLTLETTLPPATVRTLALNFTAVDCRYWKFVVLIDGASGLGNLVEVSGNQSTICAPPAKVLNVRGIGACEGAQLTVRWDAAATATGYRLRITNPQGSSAINVVGNVTEFVAAPAAIGLALTFQVLAFNECGDGPYSDPVTLTACPIAPPPEPPPTPTGLTGLGVCEGTQNTLRWDPAATAHKYELRVNGGTPVDVGSVLTWIHTPVVLGTSYAYELRAWNPDGYSAWSSPVTIVPCAPPPPPPPGGGFQIYTVEGCEGPQVTLWVAPAAGSETYEIWRYSDLWPDGELVYAGLLPTQTSPFVDKVPIAVTVRYRARGVNPGGNTGYTGYLSVTPCPGGCTPTSFAIDEDCCSSCSCGSVCNCTESANCGAGACPAVVGSGTGDTVSSGDTETSGSGTATGGSGTGTTGGGHGH